MMKGTLNRASFLSPPTALSASEGQGVRSVTRSPEGTLPMSLAISAKLTGARVGQSEQAGETSPGRRGGDRVVPVRTPEVAERENQATAHARDPTGLQPVSTVAPALNLHSAPSRLTSPVCWRASSGPCGPPHSK